LQHVRIVLVEVAGPARRAVGDGEHLRADADALAGDADGAGDDVVGPQLAAGRERVEVVALIAQDARRGAHGDLPDVRQARDERVGQSHAEILFARAAPRSRADEAQGEDGD
jgi:hypothetical protein